MEEADGGPGKSKKRPLSWAEWPASALPAQCSSHDAQGGLGLECERIFSDMPHTHTYTYTSVASLFQISGVNLGSEATLTLYPQ